MWDATIATNLSGAYYCCYHALTLMPAGGNIINIGMAGLEGIRANTARRRLLRQQDRPAGADARAGRRVRGAADSREHGVARAARQLRRSAPPDEIGRWVPLGRSGTLDDIAQAVHYLLDAAYVTGVNIDVAGGYRL